MILDRLNALTLAISRVLYKFTEGYEERLEWQDVRDCLEEVTQDLSHLECDRVRGVIADFDKRLSVKMIGRP